MKVLLVRFSALGDVVLTTGPLKRLKELKPDIEVDFLTSETGFEVLRNNIELNQCLIIEKGLKFGKLIQFYKNLPDYDIIIDWQGSLKSQLLRFFSKARFLTIRKHSRERRAFVKNRKFRAQLNKHTVEKYYQVLKKAFDLKDQSPEALRPKLFASNLVFEKKDFSNSIVIHPYASQRNKVWPYMNELIEKLHEKQFSVIVIGQDSNPMEFKESKKTMDLTNKTTFHETLAVIRQAKALISTDSGPLHLGVALGKPTLTLFGPTTKEFGFAPVFENTEVLEVQGLDCRPCHIHGGDVCPEKHFKCMKDLSVSQVFGRFEKFLME